MSNRIDPPFRADHVGSLLRPATVHEARARAAAGEITAAELRSVEDAAIAAAVARLADTGIRSLTDGEYRRAFFHLDFLEQLEGVAVTGR
ncbi:MAG: 5-methyltetrahydropteroyltriglutamate--homocysteine S-methyltransferase, partial [Acidimicrobiia bacterium]|nr:5-methyltetrahydropteroyltriglutamate--homocysteine S-methyltransferase [Acidimicrobiia bacterium]